MPTDQAYTQEQEEDLPMPTHTVAHTGNRLFLWLLLTVLLSLAPTYVVHAKKTNTREEQNSKTILQKIKELCNKYPLKKGENPDTLTESEQTSQKQKKKSPWTQQNPEKIGAKKRPPVVDSEEKNATPVDPSTDQPAKKKVVAKVSEKMDPLQENNSKPTKTVASTAQRSCEKGKCVCKEILLERSLSVHNQKGNTPGTGMVSGGRSLFKQGKSVGILDAYDAIKDLYAYDPVVQHWVPVHTFAIVQRYHQTKELDPTIDRKLYVCFCAYDATKQEWHIVTLLPYLQQTDTQINNTSLSTVQAASLLPPNPNLTEDIIQEGLLEELLGVHTVIPTMRKGTTPSKKNIWKHASFEIALGTGVTFYENKLQDMRLLVREGKDHYLVSKTNNVYQPNWFHYAVTPVAGLDTKQLHRVAHGTNYQTSFQGRGAAWPITLVGEYTFWNKLVVGIGKEIVCNRIAQLKHDDTSMPDTIYKLPQKWFFQGRWLAKGGWYLLHTERHKFLLDLRFFWVYHFGNNLYKTFTFGSYLHQTMAWNGGIRYEKPLTRLVSLSTRLSLERQRFKQFSDQAENIVYNQHAAYVQVGLLLHLGQKKASFLKTKEMIPENTLHTITDVSIQQEAPELLDLT